MRAGSRALWWAALAVAWLGWGLLHWRQALATMIVYNLALCLPARRLIRPAPATPRRLPVWAAPAAALAAGGVVALVAAASAAMPAGGELARLLAALGVSGGSVPLTLAWLAVVNPVLEEKAWRGAVLPALCSRWGEARGTWAQAVLFGAYHAVTGHLLLGAEYALPAALLATAAGWALARLARWEGGVRLAIALHLGADLALVVVAARALA